MTAHAPLPISQLRLYQDWLAQQHGLRFVHYEDLHRWSVDHLADFWRSIWDYYQLESPTPITQVLSDDPMPYTQWFTGAQASLPRQLLRHVQAADRAGLPAIVSDNERGETREMYWPELQRQIASVAIALRELGVEPGDRVAAYLPNIPETIVAMLACISIGGVWSVCAPDMGVAAVVDRFQQIEPKVLIAVDGVFYGGKALDRSAVVQTLLTKLPTVRHRIIVRSPYAATAVPDSHDWHWATQQDAHAIAAFEPVWLPFDHPIWIVYSSGTTGLPKPIVHGTGGILLALHVAGMHNDLGASYNDNNRNERFHWYSSTGWVMWNIQVSGLLFGTTITIFDGHPAGSSSQADWSVLWRFAAKHSTTIFGAGAAYYTNCMKAGLNIAAITGLQQIRTLGSTGSPLAPEVQRWGSEQLAAAGAGDVFWCNISGGTDFCGAFIGGNRDTPQTPGRMQCRWLGHAVEAWDEHGQAVRDQVAELVCVKPIPSMPLYFWNDPGKQRYLDSYFDHWPGIWRHGDWLQVNSDGSCVIYGRSDATINRQGLRMGTSEIYNAIEALPEVQDSLVVDLEYLGKDSYMPLFVVLRNGLLLDDALQTKIAHTIRTALSPRFVPDTMEQVAEIPRTLTGKKLELPIKKLLLGQPASKVLNPETMANPGCLPWYEGFAQRYLARIKLT